MSEADWDVLLTAFWAARSRRGDKGRDELHRKARACLTHHIERAPNDARLLTRLADVWLEADRYNIDPPSDWSDRARLAARSALRAAPTNGDAYAGRAMLAFETGEDIDIFFANAEQAAMLNPNDPEMLVQLGTWMSYAGAWEEGIRWIERGKRLLPKHPRWWHFVSMLNSYRLGNYAQAVKFGHMMDQPDETLFQIVLAAAYAMAGRDDDARATIVHIRQVAPDDLQNPLAQYQRRRFTPEMLERLAQGLRRAGLKLPISARSL